MQVKIATDVVHQKFGVGNGLGMCDHVGLVAMTRCVVTSAP